MTPAIAAIQGPGPWRFLPQGVLWHAGARALVIADLHLGYEHKRARGGDCLPRYSVGDVFDRLDPLFAFTSCETLVVAGDVVESRDALKRDSNALGEFVAGLKARRVQPIFIQGNHDTGNLGGCPESYVIDGWTIHHGHHGLREKNESGPAEIIGHLHPSLRWNGHAFRVFLSVPNQILLPAFSTDAAGVDLADLSCFPESTWGSHECWVCRDGDVLPFGKLAALRTKLAGLGTSEDQKNAGFRKFRQARR
jgi:metallophosphoesterase superfamily enzyme